LTRSKAEEKRGDGLSARRDIDIGRAESPPHIFLLPHVVEDCRISHLPRDHRKMISGQRAYRRRLPHYQSDFRTYFVTFVTRDRLVLPPRTRDIVLQHIVGCDLYYLHVAVVIPDHVHLIATPHSGCDGWSLPIREILRRVKGASAYEVNTALKRRGALWLDESFDHEIRGDESLAQKCEYVRQNPVRKGLVTRPADYPWLWSRYA
jgi:putative transposase